MSGEERQAVSQGKYALAQQIFDLLEEELAGTGFELLDVRIFRGGGRLQVRIFVDRPGGVDLGACAEASRTAGMLLEQADLITERYLIEVSSPGIRRPLRKPDHFAAQVGELVEVKTGAAGRPGRIRGELVAVDEGGIRIRPAGSAPEDPGETPAEIVFAYREILEANLDSEFDIQALIRADRRRRKDQQRKTRRRPRAKKPPGRAKR